MAQDGAPSVLNTQEVAEAEAAFTDSLPTGEEFLNTPPEADQAAAEAAPPEEGTTEEQGDPLALPDSFTPQDVRGMLEAIDDPAAKAAAEAAVKNFQADYTRSKQQLSEQAQQFQGLDDLEKARAAVEFYDGIQNDPEFALEVHEYLSKVFQEAGMSPGEAAQAASQEMATPAQEAQAEAPSFDEDPDAALKAQLDQLKARQDAWDERQNAFLREQQEAELAGELLRQEMALRQAHPTLDDSDFEAIYDFAVAKGGNLLEAHEALAARDQHVIERYMASKQSAPPPEPTPAAAQAAPEIPRTADGSVDLEAVHRLAQQRLANAMAGRE